MKETAAWTLGILYELASWATFVKLTFLSGYAYNAWNWIIVVPINALLGQLWPIYWLVLRPLFGH